MKILVLLGLALGAQVNAQTLVSAEPKVPYIVATCNTIGTDLVGALGLKMESFSVTQTRDQVTISVASSLSVCHLSVDANQNKSLNWESVNPYKGFFVQYFDDATSSIKNRPVFIDASKPNNRIELIAATDDTQVTQKFTKSRMEESLENTFSSSLTLNKADLLSEKELALIKSGKTVKKIVELYHIGNFTTSFDGLELQLGDKGLSAQNVVLTFKK